MTSDQFCNMLDRIEELGNMRLPELRIFADIEQGVLSNGTVVNVLQRSLTMNLEIYTIEIIQRRLNNHMYKCQCWNIQHKSRCTIPSTKICKTCGQYLCVSCAKNNHVHTAFDTIGTNRVKEEIKS